MFRRIGSFIAIFLLTILFSCTESRDFTAFHGIERSFSGMGGQPVCASLNDNIMFTAAGEWVCAVDISKPLNPQTVARWKTDSYAGRIVNVGNRIYFLEFAVGLFVLDFDGKDFQFKGKIELPGELRGLCVDGQYVYIADKRRGLSVVDASNPAAMKEVSVSSTKGWAWTIVKEGNFVYLADLEKGLVIFDVSNPLVPVKKSAQLSAGPVWDVAVAGDRAYVVCGSSVSTAVFDISKPNAPVLISKYKEENADYRALSLLQGSLYCVDQNYGLSVFAAADELTEGKRVFSGAGYSEFLATEGHLMVFGAQKAIGIIDRVSGSFETRAMIYPLTEITGTVMQSNSQYFADSSSGLVILQNGLQTRVYDKSVAGIASSRDFILFSTVADGLGVYDPKALKTVFTPDPQAGTLVAFGKDFLRAGENGSLSLIAIAGKMAKVANTVALSPRILDISVQGDMIWTAEGDSGVGLYAVENGKIIKRGMVKTTGPALSVYGSQNKLFVAQGDRVVEYSYAKGQGYKESASLPCDGLTDKVRCAGSYVFYNDAVKGIHIVHVAGDELKEAVLLEMAGDFEVFKDSLTVWIKDGGFANYRFVRK